MYFYILFLIVCSAEGSYPGNLILSSSFPEVHVLCVVSVFSSSNPRLIVAVDSFCFSSLLTYIKASQICSGAEVSFSWDLGGGIGVFTLMGFLDIFIFLELPSYFLLLMILNLGYVKKQFQDLANLSSFPNFLSVVFVYRYKPENSAKISHSLSSYCMRFG